MLLKERMDKYKKVLTEQLRACLEEVKLTQAERVVIAYEPIWAIGTEKRRLLKSLRKFMPCTPRPVVRRAVYKRV